MKQCLKGISVNNAKKEGIVLEHQLVLSPGGSQVNAHWPGLSAKHDPPKKLFHSNIVALAALCRPTHEHRSNPIQPIPFLDSISVAIATKQALLDPIFSLPSSRLWNRMPCMSPRPAYALTSRTSRDARRRSATTFAHS